MTNCPHCGVRLPSTNDAFCSECGRELLNPVFNSPEHAEGLNEYQKGYLRLLHVIGPATPSISALYRRSLAAALLFPFLIIGIAFAAFSLGRQELGYILSGMAIGCFSRDYGQFRRSVRVWPALAAVIDWDKVTVLSTSEASSISASVRADANPG